MQVIKFKNKSWVELKNPDKRDIELLKKKFKLHPLIFKEFLPPLDYPRIEKFDDYIFIVLFYPFFDKESYGSTPFELDIIISKNYIITSHYKDIVPLKSIFDKCNLYQEVKKDYFNKGTEEILYQIIKELLVAYRPKLGKIKKDLDEVEREIYQQKHKESVKKISLIRREIIGFERTINPQEIVFKELAKGNNKILRKKYTPYFHDLLSIYRQTVELLNTNHKTLSALKSTNQSLLTNKTNEVIKILTIFSVIVLPLTLIAGIFGMNTTYFPFWGNLNDFWIILISMGVITLGMLLLFKYKKWI